MAIGLVLLQLLLNLASATEITRLHNLEDQVFLKFNGLRTLCSDSASLSRDVTTRKCIRALESILKDSQKDWQILGGIYLNTSNQVPESLQDLANPQRDIFGFTWLPYEFTSAQVISALENSRNQRTQEINYSAILTSLVGRKIEFRCLDTNENCQEILRKFGQLSAESMTELKVKTWITVVQVWSEHNNFPRIAPNGSFSEYQLNLTSREDLNLESL